jgi:hypothetical protein
MSRHRRRAVPIFRGNADKKFYSFAGLKAPSYAPFSHEAYAAPMLPCGECHGTSLETKKR